MGNGNKTTDKTEMDNPTVIIVVIVVGGVVVLGLCLGAMLIFGKRKNDCRYKHI